MNAAGKALSTDVLWEEEVPGGMHTSFVMKRGSALRLTDIEGGGNVSALFYNVEEKLERYNMADTLKAQHTAYLTKGFVCYSDMGRVLASVIEDRCGWHDTLCGMSNAVLVQQKYGVANYQTHRNAMHRNARDSFIVELGKWGMGKRDIVPNVNFFSKVSADENGALHFHPDHSAAGDFVELRFEMNVLVVLAAGQHPLDPDSHYRPRPVRLSAWRSGTPDQHDYCRNFRPENVRGFFNTELLFR
jgi:urea carboxylase-associated protein 2